MAKPLRKATVAEVCELREAARHLADALIHARRGGASARTLARLRAARASLGGAIRHAERAWFRWERPRGHGSPPDDMGGRTP